ncbi:MAG: hypothetical protein ACI8WB_004621 [Phenylobacterium sp.]|jgi:hypothetical protein
MHLMPENYSKIQLGQLVSAIWSKYLSLQGGDVENQRQLLAKDKEIFQQSKDMQELRMKIEDMKTKNQESSLYSEFESFLKSGKINQLIHARDSLLTNPRVRNDELNNIAEAIAFGLIQSQGNIVGITDKGKEFFKWYILQDG